MVQILNFQYLMKLMKVLTSLNMKYSHVLVTNNQTPQPAIFNDIALPMTIKEDPQIVISTTTPESIFANAEISD